jgi:putative membrane protein
MASNIDEEDRPGLPRGTVAAVLTPTKPVLASEPVLRQGDTELGRPIQKPLESAPLTVEDRERITAAEEEETRRALAEAEELLASDPALPWLGWFANPIASAFLLGSVGLLGLYLYSQTLNILANLASPQPTWIQYCGYTLLGGMALLVLYAMTRLLLVYVRLRANRQLRIQGLEELHSRTRLRWLAQAKAVEAKTRLEQYLKDFPLQSDREFKQLEHLGFTEEQCRRLVTVRTELLDPAKFATTAEWFATFQERFQSNLDAAAEARITYWSNRAMIVTALSPNSLVDSVSTVYFGFAMLNDLCRVYNLRAGRTGTTVLLSRVFFHAYLSGQVNDFEKLAEEQYEQLFHQGFQVIGFGVSSNVVGKLLGKVGAKATTGYLNRVLLARLGKYACRLLRPVA